MTAYEWATLALGLVAGIGGPVVMYVHGSIRKQLDTLWEKHDEMVKAREKTASDHAEFRIVVTRDYVTRDLLDAFEKRMDGNFRELKSDFKAGMEALTRAFEAHRADDAKR